MSEADVINESCQTAAWSGGISFYPPMTSFAALQAQLDAWSLFTAADLEGVPVNMVILPGSGITNGMATINATVNGKPLTVYGWSRPFGMNLPGPCTMPFGTNGKCSLMIPGSGNNQGDAIVMLNSGYQAIMYNTLNTLGDTMVYIPPGSDFRSLKGANGLGYLASGIDNYLQEKGSSLALLAQIEMCVLMAWIKSNYTKTAVLGISKGAWPALMVALAMSPTAAVCASGVSLASQMQGFEAAGGNIIPGVMPTATQIAARITASPTKFRISQSNGGNEIALELYEAQTGITQALLSSPNVSDVTHSTGHLYDPSMGAWITGVMT